MNLKKLTIFLILILVLCALKLIGNITFSTITVLVIASVLAPFPILAIKKVEQKKYFRLTVYSISSFFSSLTTIFLGSELIDFIRQTFNINDQFYSVELITFFLVFIILLFLGLLYKYLESKFLLLITR